MSSRSDIKAGAAYVELYVKNNKLVKGLQDARKRVADFGASLVRVGAGIAATGGAIVGAMLGAVLSFAATGDELDKMAARTGVAASALAGLSFAAEQSGSDLQTIERGLQGLSRSVYDASQGSLEAVEALEKIGLTAEDLAGKLPDEQLQMVADGLAGIADASTRGAVAQKLLGRSGRQLLPMISSLRELRQEAKDLGLEPSPESVAAAASLTDAINRVRRVVGATVFEIGATLAPMVSRISEALLRVATGANEFIRANREMIVTAAKAGLALVAVGAVIAAAGGAVVGASLAFAVLPAIMTGVATAAGLVMSVVGGIGAVFATITSPIGLLVAGIAAVTFAWLRFSQVGQSTSGAISGFFGNVIERGREMMRSVLSTMGSIKDALLLGDVGAAMEIAMISGEIAVTAGMNKIASIVGGVWGDTLATITSQLLNGDFTGAFGTALAGLESMWQTFSNAIVSMFASAAKAIVKSYQGMIDKLANMILQQAGEGGVFGAAFKGFSGIDVQAEMKRNAALNAQFKAIGNDSKGAAIFDEVAAGTFRSPEVSAAADKALEAIDAYQATSDKALAEANENFFGGIKDGVVKADTDLSALQKRLAELKAGVANDIEKRNAAGAVGGAKPGSGGSSSGGLFGASSQVFTSAAAFAAAGQTAKSNPAIIELKQIRQAILMQRKENRENARNIADAARDGGGLALE